MKERTLYALDKAQDYAVEVLEEESGESPRAGRTEEIYHATKILANVCKCKAHAKTHSYQPLMKRHDGA